MTRFLWDRIRDYDNIEMKNLLDIITAYLLEDDSGQVCDSSLEIKNIGKRANFFYNSRATGILFSPDDLYAVYNTADAEMKWEFDSELRLKVFMLQRILHHTQEPNAIILARDMQQLPMIIFFPL